MVFIDASNGEESIELVNHDSIETESSNEAAPVERKDIVEAQALPKNTKGHLYYSNQEGLDASRNKVQSRPKIDEQIKGHMTTLAEILQKPEFASFHVTGKEVNGTPYSHVSQPCWMLLIKLGIFTSFATYYMMPEPSQPTLSSDPPPWERIVLSSMPTPKIIAAHSSSSWQTFATIAYGGLHKPGQTHRQR
ncbi:hypothetical protein OS493_019140 [Desmophyllum pertusum]|uniref:Uncharacterized protein n=1 Tax=Desmophyllum pertusum TaxID=174260 RepID=A0A9W9YR70_9CNID|nr:hypothetical protein OS493_019140 [Desmophyllum pertusum]